MATFENSNFAVVCSAHLDLFCAMCNKRIEEGWTPLGGMIKGEYEFFLSFTKHYSDKAPPVEEKPIPPSPKKRAGRPRRTPAQS